MLRFGILGCGAMGSVHARVLTGAAAPADRARLVAVAARDLGSAERLAGQVGVDACSVESLLDRDDVDVVVVAVPSGRHAEIGERALRRGKHVLVEKPVDVTLEAADRLLAAAAEQGRTLGVVSQHRFTRAARIAHEAIRSGELGTLTSVTVEVPLWRGSDYYRGGWRGSRELDGGGALMNQGVHLVDLALWLAGPVIEVSARTATAVHPIEVEDVVAAHLVFASGALGTLLATTAAYPGRLPRLSVGGDRGSLVLDDDTLSWFHAASPDAEVGAYGAYGAGNQAPVRIGVPDPVEDVRDPGGLPQHPVRSQLVDFCDAIEHGRAPLVDGAGARRALATVLAVYDSARDGGAAVRPDVAGPAPDGPGVDVAALFDRCAPDYENVGVEYFDPMGRLLVDRVRPEPGQTVLDVGCGTGACLVPAARAVGPDGRVVGVDISPKMVERSRAAAAGHGLHTVRCAVADAGRLDLDADLLPPAGVFDVALSGMALFFVPDPAAALARIAELLCPGGRIGISWWGDGDERWEPVFAASALFGRGPSAHTVAHSSPFRSVGAFEQAVVDSGFTRTETTEFPLTTRFTDSEQWWEWLWSTAGRMFWESVPAVDMPHARAAVEQALAELRDPDGSLVATGTVRLTTATRSS